MIAAGILITLLMKWLVFNRIPTHPIIYDFILTTLVTIVAWEGNLRIDHWLNGKYPWTGNTGKRIAIQAPLAFLYTSAAILALTRGYKIFVCGEDPKHEHMAMMSLIIGLMITGIILIGEICSQFFTSWKKSLVEVEKYKAESIQAQLQNLKNQINPHFLFNNLSVLSSLVYRDQDKAVGFIDQLSKVYRYLLSNRNVELIALKDELAFLRSYIYLLQIRFDTHIAFDIDAGEEWMHFMLPPMSLQILVENAIKHNEVASDAPLLIRITADDDMLTVANNLQARIRSEESSGTGLQNIQSRYAFFTDRKLIIRQDEHEFCVSIPLLRTRPKPGNSFVHPKEVMAS